MSSYLDSSWFANLTERIEALKNREELRIRRFQTYAPVSLFLLEYIEHSVGIAIPDSIISLYRITDGLDLYWEQRDPNNMDQWFIAGAINFSSFSTLFGNWSNRIWGVAGETYPYEHDFTWDLWGFDGFGEAPPPPDLIAPYEHQSLLESPSSPDSTSLFPWQTVLRLTPNDPTNVHLYLHNPELNTLPIEMTFIDYCDTLLDTLGTIGWPLLAVDLDTTDTNLVSSAIKAYHTIRHLFPERDISYLRSPHDFAPLSTAAHSHEPPQYNTLPLTE